MYIKEQIKQHCYRAYVGKSKLAIRQILIDLVDETLDELIPVTVK